VHLTALELADFRNYSSAAVALTPGANVFLGPNGHGKTNLAEAVCYLASLSSHRAGSDVALVRAGAERAVVRARAVRRDRELAVELELNPGRANRARLAGSACRRPRDVLGAVRAVLFAPEDLALVKGDPGERRRYLDELLVARAPRLAGVRADYERVLKQRTALLKTVAAPKGRRRQQDTGTRPLDTSTLETWDAHLAGAGAELLAARLALVDELRPLVAKNYDAVAADGKPATIDYRASFELAAPEPGGLGRDRLRDALTSALADARPAEIDRGVCLVGPHRDDVDLAVGALPARGYDSHGESWSLALTLRLAAYDLLRADDPDGEPVLVLDDVFAELDAARRARLAELVAPAEQLLVTAAVPDDVPPAVDGPRFEVRDGTVRRDD
jgi:DNA replication and repair protein RecF